jgi:large subunit ribosomal protein L24
LKIRKNDNVLILIGKDKGKQGKVRFVYPKKENSNNDRLIVEGVNMIKKHARPTGRARQAGVIERESLIHISNVKLICNKCNKPGRIGSKTLDNGNRVRYCKSCGEVID